MQKGSRKIYVLKCQEFYKIGITKSIKKRLSTLSCALPFDIELIAYYEPKLKGKDEYAMRKIVCQIESYLHFHFSAKRKRGEWFQLTDDDIASIPDLIKKGVNFEKASVSNSGVPTAIEMDE